MLTVIDAADPAHPHVAGRLEFHPHLPDLSAYMPMLPWRNELLYQRSLWPPELGSFDISDPAHPRPKAAVRHLYDQVILSGSGPSLFQPWKNGLLEYQPADAGLQALRYLSDGNEDGHIYHYAQAGAYIYAWKASRMSNQPGSSRVEAFRVSSAPRRD
jgi:hypothetical protein